MTKVGKELTLYLKETPFNTFANWNRADPDQAALRRAAWSESNLFANLLLCNQGRSCDFNCRYPYYWLDNVWNLWQYIHNTVGNSLTSLITSHFIGFLQLARSNRILTKILTSVELLRSVLEYAKFLLGDISLDIQSKIMFDGYACSCVAIKLNFWPYILRYTSLNENFEYSYPLIQSQIMRAWGRFILYRYFHMLSVHIFYFCFAYEE